MNWETVNPEWWVPRGYAAVRVDGRGSGKSPGQCEPWSLAEAIDFYDAIEWAAAQPWCNGNVGLSGISYYAINQWFVANLQPPSLKAIMPWEGFADHLPRRALPRRHPERVHDQLVHRAPDASHARARLANLPDGWQVNTLWFWLHNNLDSGALRGAQAQWDRITVPMFTVGNWTGFGLHLRGNTEAFMRAASKHKKLRIHTGSHVHPFYTEEGRRDQLRFFDYWLKDIDNGVMDEPPVKLAIRKGGTRSNGATNTSGRSSARSGPSSISICRTPRTAGAGDSATWCARSRLKPPPAAIPRPASARWARPRRPRRR